MSCPTCGSTENLEVEDLYARLEAVTRERDEHVRGYEQAQVLVQELVLALREAREAWAGKDWDSGRSMRCRERVDAILAQHEPPATKCWCGPDYACPVCWDEKVPAFPRKKEA